MLIRAEVTMELRDTSALVTGASRGLGAALAMRLSSEGARVALVARHGAELAAVVERVRAAGGDAHAIEADLGDKRSVHAIAAQAAAFVGPIDILVHNASTLGHVPLRPWLDTDCEALEEALAVNLVGPLRLTKLVAGPMVLRGRGVIVHVTSDASVGAYPGWGAYAASKAAFDSMGRTLGAELDGGGVRVVSVDPGEMDTRMHAEALPGADRALLLDPDAVARRVVRMLRAIESLPNGARVEAAAWPDPS
jgi:NAD(P)-dependent dehydrogenase (short-subunit alcohol dehydrogenase family)